jgi:hypothetical protein
MTATTERHNRKQANQQLAALPSYHPYIPNQTVDAILIGHGFKPLEEGLYCGREGRLSEQVGERTWINLTWFKMPSGNYEIVSYLS